MNGLFADNPNYRDYEKLLIDLHAHLANGREAEADTVRDAMEIPEQGLSSEEIQRLNGLSADLYMLQNAEIYESWAGTPRELAVLLKDAGLSRNAEAILSLLRKGPAITKDRAAYFRSRAYRQLGHDLPASLFIQYAVSLNPNETIYRWEMATLLPGKEACDIALAIINDPQTSADYIFASATIIVQSIQELPETNMRRLLGIVRHKLELLLSDQNMLSRLQFKYIGKVYVLLGFCYQSLNRNSKAEIAYTKAIELLPERDDLYIWRGFLRVPRNINDALADFARAIQMKSTSPTPYLFVGKKLMEEEDYIQARQLCETLIVLTKDPIILSIVWEWIAICDYELNCPIEQVKSEFRMAIDFDPQNKRANDNFMLVLSENQQARKGLNKFLTYSEIKSEDILRSTRLVMSNDFDDLGLAIAA